MERSLKPEQPPEYEPIKVERNGVDLKEYRIVLPEDGGAATEYAGAELKKYLKNVSGEELAVVSDSAPRIDREIAIGKTNRAEEDFSALGSDGYHLRTNGETLILASNNEREFVRGLCLFGDYGLSLLLGGRLGAARRSICPPRLWIIGWFPKSRIVKSCIKTLGIPI